MQKIKFYPIPLLLFLFITYKCNTPNSPKENIYDFEQINAVLRGETLNKKFTNKSSSYSTINYTCDVNYVGNDNISNEANIIFKHTKVDTCYKSLNTFYNKHFNSNQNNKTFNSWSTNSLEVLLFKQTDSTILVNIFIKSYR